MERKQEKECEKQKQLSRSKVPAALSSSLSSKRSSISTMHFPSLMKTERGRGRRESEPQFHTSINKAKGDKDTDIVSIKDLSWSDKELVLRTLFAKLNESPVPKENAETGRRRQSDDTEPLFFISEGAIDFSPDGTYGHRCDSLGTTTSTV